MPLFSMTVAHFAISSANHGLNSSVLIVGTGIASIFAICDEPREDAMAGIRALKAASWSWRIREPRCW